MVLCYPFAWVQIHVEFAAPVHRWVDRKLLEGKAFEGREASLVRGERGSWVREASVGHRKHVVT